MFACSYVRCLPFGFFAGKVYNNKDQAIDVYGSDVEVDYRGYEVSLVSSSLACDMVRWA